MFSWSDTKNIWIPGISRKPKGLAFAFPALSTTFSAQGGDPRRVAQATRKVLFVNHFSRPYTLWAITKFDKKMGITYFSNTDHLVFMEVPPRAR
jgi:hypothetical protein